MSDNILLKLNNITKDFPGTRALDKVNLEVKRGEVHAVIGENGAGKSTLMNIIAGVLSPTKGSIEFDGKPVKFSVPLDSQNVGIGIVHQEINLCPQISVQENIFIGRLPKKFNRIDYKKLTNNTKEVLKGFQTKISPKSKVNDLTIAQQQIVEIAKSLSLDCKLIIFDEPTSSLTEVESLELFEIIRELKRKGISVLYISHRLSEIMDICETVTVLRDGKYIGTEKVRDVDTNQLISMMVGRKLANIFPKKSDCSTEEILFEIRNFSGGELFKNASFQLKKGEILGFSGLVGAGRTELFRAICAIDKKTTGEVFFKGKQIKLNDYMDAIKNGIAYMTENRKEDGLFLDFDVKRNIVASSLDRISTGLLIKDEKEKKLSEEMVEKIKIKVTSIKQGCSSLSGGNQQKVLLSKWLAINPQLLIIDEPTRGIDVGVRLEIYTMLRQLCNEGIGIIIISSDLMEVIGLCDRVITMREGQITGDISGLEIGEESIMREISVE